jgi:DNA-binding transcriptional LysR family regulator
MIAAARRASPPFAGLAAFVAVAELRSFRRAAERLGVTVAAVSKSVARLEADLGARLLARTSRAVSLTPEGERFLEPARQALALVQAAREEVSAAGALARGPLHVSASPILAPAIVSALPTLRARHPGLALRLAVSDRTARLAEDGVDVALRVGPPGGVGLVARKLRGTRWVTLASPAYLARHGAPATPDDLRARPSVRFVLPSGRVRAMTFHDGAREVTVEPPSAVDVDDGRLLLEAAAAGVGPCQVLDFMVGPYVRDGRLVELLAHAAADGPPLHAVWLPARRTPPRIAAFVAFAAEVLGRV